MNGPRQTVTLGCAVSNSREMHRIAGVDDQNLRRDAGLRIRRSRDSNFAMFLPYGDLFPPPKAWDTEVELDPNELLLQVDQCRSVWMQAVVNYREQNPTKGLLNAIPFQDEFNLSGRPELLERAGRQLAIAGDKLFSSVFRHANLRDLRETLATASRAKSLVLTITSDVFFVPWGMMYVHPDPDRPLNKSDGSNFRWEGFWGLRHIVEHNTEWIDLRNALPVSDSDRLKMSINVDESLDEQFNVACVASQIDFFKLQPQLETEIRTTSADLCEALSGPDFVDRVLYFYCHGCGARDRNRLNLESPTITLTDGKPICHTDIQYWRRGLGSLDSHPLVFINACQGGQMHTLFYKTLAIEFLKQEATGLIGSQIDVPALFAAEYAQRFFKRFSDWTDTPVRIGPLMRDLAWEFVRKECNPLGIAYSLYRGADCHVSRGRENQPLSWHDVNQP